MENLGINSKFMSEEPVSNESVNYIITKFQNHPSIMKIKENHHVAEDVDREIDSLDASKAIYSAKRYSTKNN